MLVCFLTYTSKKGKKNGIELKSVEGKVSGVYNMLHDVMKYICNKKIKNKKMASKSPEDEVFMMSCFCFLIIHVLLYKKKKKWHRAQKRTSRIDQHILRFFSFTPFAMGWTSKTTSCD